jgi:hypothetical protein
MEDEKKMTAIDARKGMLPAFEGGTRTNAPLRPVYETEFENVLAHISRLYFSGETIAGIAKELGMNKMTVADVYLLELRSRWRQSADMDFAERQALELAKLDALEAEYYKGWERSQQLKSTQKRVDVYGRNAEKRPSELETTTEQLVGDARFLDGIHKCIDRRCRLIGVDPETKIRLTTPTQEQTHDLDIRLKRYEAQFGVSIHIGRLGADALTSVDEQRPDESVDTARSPSPAVGVSDVIDAEWRDSAGGVLRGRDGRGQE